MEQNKNRDILVILLNELVSSSCVITEDGEDIKIEFTNNIAAKFAQRFDSIKDFKAVSDRVILTPIYNEDFILVCGELSYFNKYKNKKIRKAEKRCAILLSEKTYLLIDQNEETISNTKKKNVTTITKHIHQYIELYELFDSNINLIEHKIPASDGQKLIIVNKSTYKTVSSILFKKNCINFLEAEFEKIDLVLFSEKIKSNEWLSCFKEEVCKFADNQNISTFDRLYHNFNYLFNIAEKNFQLFITNFSFENVLNKYKDQKEKYFSNLSSVKEKIGNQIVSIPLTLGASLFALFQLEKANQINTIILIVNLYSFFIIYLIATYIYELESIKKESKNDRKKLNKLYPSLYEDIDNQFKSSDVKAQLILIMAWSIIVSLIISLILIYFFFNPSVK